ncbi:MAG: hypothetical protein EOP09_16910 [Proteobacteria bacterium]|nr:MAG: hypothetical protein EOP09_16910 [Pseudomonadota bacterium]
MIKLTFGLSVLLALSASSFADDSNQPATDKVVVLQILGSRSSSGEGFTQTLAEKWVDQGLNRVCYVIQSSGENPTPKMSCLKLKAKPSGDALKVAGVKVFKIEDSHNTVENKWKASLSEKWVDSQFKIVCYVTQGAGNNGNIPALDCSPF